MLVLLSSSRLMWHVMLPPSMLFLSVQLSALMVFSGLAFVSHPVSALVTFKSMHIVFINTKKVTFRKNQRWIQIYFTSIFKGCTPSN